VISDNESGLISLSVQFKNSQNKLKFWWAKTPLTYKKVANFFTNIKHTFCNHNAKQSFQASSRRTALNFSSAEGHG
jgi:hypothetical protein